MLHRVAAGGACVPEFARPGRSVSDVAEGILGMPSDDAHATVFDALVPARLLSRSWFVDVAYPPAGQPTWTVHMRQEIGRLRHWQHVRSQWRKMTRAKKNNLDLEEVQGRLPTTGCRLCARPRLGSDV